MSAHAGLKADQVLEEYSTEILYDTVSDVLYFIAQYEYSLLYTPVYVLCSRVMYGFFTRRHKPYELSCIRKSVPAGFLLRSNKARPEHFVHIEKSVSCLFQR